MQENSTSRRVYKLFFAALVAGSLIFHAAILWESRHRIAAGYGDFLIFYTGAQIVNDGRRTELFKIDVQNAYQEKFDVPQLAWPLPFNHAPYELVIFLPLARLSYPAAHMIWSGANVLLLILMLRWMLPYVNSPDNWLVATALAAWFPTVEALRLGQDSILSAALLLAVFFCLKKKQDGWAGVLLALGLYKPQLVLPLAGALLVARRWRAAVVFGAVGAVLAVVSIAMVGLQGVWDFLSLLKSMEEYSFVIYPPNMPNVRGLLYSLLNGSDGKSIVAILTAGISLALYALCLYAWRREWRPENAEFDLQFALVVVTTVLISYHLYAHDLFPISISLILLYRYVSIDSRRQTSIAFFGLLLIVFLPVLPRFLIEMKLFSWAALAVLCLYTILAVEIFSSRRFASTTR
jgi:hypothetical protein